MKLQFSGLFSNNFRLSSGPVVLSIFTHHGKPAKGEGAQRVFSTPLYLLPMRAHESVSAQWQVFKDAVFAVRGAAAGREAWAQEKQGGVN